MRVHSYACTGHTVLAFGKLCPCQETASRALVRDFGLRRFRGVAELTQVVRRQGPFEAAARTSTARTTYGRMDAPALGFLSLRKPLPLCTSNYREK